MSSPPAVDFPDSDVPMSDTAGDSMPNVPPVNPLFLAGTPEPTTPMHGITARRAVGMNTPKGSPLFAGTLV